jgi:hypothetical protein
MSDFPLLKTGAVLQYPAQHAAEYSTTVLRFVDGSEQRVGNYKTPIHHWIVRLGLLDESELHAFREFFRGLSGAAQNFSFTDPWDGTIYPSCSLEDSELAEQLVGPSNATTSLRIVENPD